MKRLNLAALAFVFFLCSGQARSQQEGQSQEASGPGISAVIPATIPSIAAPLLPIGDFSQASIGNLDSVQVIRAQSPARIASQIALPKPVPGLPQNASVTTPPLMEARPTAAIPFPESAETSQGTVKNLPVAEKITNVNSLRGIESGHNISANLNALFDQSDAILNRNASGDWVAADQNREASHLLSAVNYLKNRGVELPFQSVRIPQNPSLANRSGAATLVLFVHELKAALGINARAGSGAMDGLVRLLLRKHLELGVADSLRFSRSESEKIGLGAQSSLGAEEALQSFKTHWLRKFPKLVRTLRRSADKDAAQVDTVMTLDAAVKSSFIAPGQDLIFLQHSFGGAIETRGIQPNGSLRERGQTLDFGGRTLKGVYFDPAEKTLILLGSAGREYTLEKRPIRPDGQIAPASAQINFSGPPAALGAFYDEANHCFIFVGDRSLEILDFSGESPKLKTKIQTPETWSGAAYDAALKTLFLASASGGKIAAWTISSSGNLSRGPDSLITRSLGSLIFNPADKTLLGYDLAARRYEIFSTDFSGNVADENKSVAFPIAVSGKNTMAINPLNGTIYALGSLDNGFLSRAPALFYFSPDSAIKDNQKDSISDDSGLSSSVVDALAAKIGSLPGKQIQKMARLATASNRRWIGSFWIALKKYITGGAQEKPQKRGAKTWWNRISPSRDPDALTQIPGSQFWFDDQSRDMIRKRMPTLWAMLSDPKRLPKFLMALSFLRLSYPYDLNHAGKFSGGDTPISWAQAHHAVFELNELHIAPVSSSFRRHILYTEDSDGFFAVELKMPGQDKGRGYIEPENFKVAKDLWDQNPHDPGVVKPLYFGQFTGNARLYGQEINYADKEPLGLLLFSYDDGERFKHAAPQMHDIAVEKKIPFGEAVLQVAVDATVAALRLHRMGWSGSSGEWTDMHEENIRVTKDGRGVMVADFGVFSREPIGMKERRRETLRQLGQYAVPSVLNAIYPEVVKRLTENVEGAVERKQIEDDVRQELGV
ncbi:MAG: hypothetical protein ACYCPQ_05550 [Elusimicrobiota bacterium]